jgi:hypothetical protein
MIHKIKEVIKAIFKIPSTLYFLSRATKKTDDLLVLNGKIMSRLNDQRTNEIIDNINLAEFKIYSQFGDDGIIQFLVNYLDIDNHNFIEFGVENYKEANTRFLLINNNWSGLIMDGSQNNIDQIKKDDIYYLHDINAVSVFITKDNINELIKSSGFSREVGILSIDIDGNDYWIWKEINTIDPVIVIVEYNSLFGYDNPWTVPYKKDFYITQEHYSNLYFGTSLLSLCDLAEEKGYSFIGCTSNATNAFFVRKDKMKGLKALSAFEGHFISKFRTSRDKNGELTFLSTENRIKEIQGFDVFNTRTGVVEKIQILP